MNQKEKEIYLRIRAEQIKLQHDTVNKHFYPNGYPYKSAYELAENQLEFDLKRGKLRITLDELLLNDDNKCINIVEMEVQKLVETLY